MNSALNSGRLLNTQGFYIYFDQLSRKYMYQPRYVVIREIYGVCVCANVHIYIYSMYVQYLDRVNILCTSALMFI